MSFLDVPPTILESPDPDLEPTPTEFTPNSVAQALVFNSWAPSVGYSGRFGSSKSRTVCEAALFDAVFWNRNRVLLTRKVQVDLFATTFQIFRDEVCPPDWFDQRDGYGFFENAKGGPTLFLRNGSVIIFLGLDNVRKVKSGQYGSIYVDQAEDLDDSERKTAEGRLRHRLKPTELGDGKTIPLRRRIVYAFNPDADSHWGNATFRFTEMQDLPNDDPERWHRVICTEEETTINSGFVVPKGYVLHEAIMARPLDNLENLPLDYQIRLSQYVGPWKKRFVDGFWGTFEGQVLPNFDRKLHVVDKPGEWDEWGGRPDPRWTRYCGIDFGFGPGHPFVFQWYAVRPAERLDDGRLRPEKWFLYREIYMTGEGHRMLHGVPGIVAEHAKKVLELEAAEFAALNDAIERWNQEQSYDDRLAALEYLSIPIRAADHDAEDRATLDMAGIATFPAIKDRLPGAQLVAEMLEPFEDPVTGKRDARLVFIRDALVEADPTLVDSDTKPPTCTWEELPGIRWLPPKVSGLGVQKEDWVKDRDHGFDALRYVLKTVRECGSVGVVHIPLMISRDDD